MSLTFAPADPAAPPAADLIAAMVAEVAALYGGRTLPGPTATPAELRPPHGSCLVGERDGEAVCVGGVKRWDEETAEIKRMYVLRAARGTGVARALLVALEDEARRLGYARARLDTGAEQPHARALYLSAGYTEIPDYNGNAYADFWAERSL